MVDPTIVGAAVGVIGTAIGALIGLAAEPIKQWATQKSRRENLHLALYGEIADIAIFFAERIGGCISALSLAGEGGIEAMSSPSTQTDQAAVDPYTAIGVEDLSLPSPIQA